MTLTCDEKGTYRWVYELNLKRNPVVLITVLKVLGFSMFLIYLFNIFLAIVDGHFMRDFFGLTKVFAVILLGFLVLGAVAYYLYAHMMGGKYCVLFEMDDKGIRHIQLAEQFKKAQAIAALTILAGAAAGKPGTIGTGLLAGSKNEMYSQFSKVKSIEPNKKLNVIKVNSPLNYNQVYIDDEDFDFVLEYIQKRVQNN